MAFLQMALCADLNDGYIYLAHRVGDNACKSWDAPCLETWTSLEVRSGNWPQENV